MKFAIITEGNWGYRLGFNGFLNGLDYHDNKNIDFFCMITDEVPQEYINKAQSTFDFRVEFPRITEYVTKYPPPAKGGARWIMEFYKYKLAQELAGEYDAIMISDCDYMVGGFLENYFAIVAGTDFIFTSNNMMEPAAHYNGANIEAYKTRIEKDNYFFPCMNSPFICDPSRPRNLELYERIYQIGSDFGEDVVPFNRGFIECKRIADVLVLPGMLWFTPDFGRVHISKMEVNGKIIYNASAEKMMMMHRHWWCPGEMYREAISGTPEGSERREMVKSNVDLLIAECKRINTEWKLPIDWDIIPAEWSSVVI